MIKGITGAAGIQVSGGSYSAPYINAGAPSAGMVRYKDNNFEVYDGSIWLIMFGGHSTVELDGPTQEAVAWARRKMEEEKRMLSLAAKHPTVADAIAAVKAAEEQLRIVTALVDNV